ncbi:hypothetical protein GCM10027064_15850 [Microbacterium petrolearium]
MPAGSPSQPSVAIIVPAYEVERYLAECLESIRAQDYPNWQAVVVIDGATDGSEAIARRFADDDGRFTVICVPNGGLGSARNIGLSHAHSDYVFFVDSDDVVPPGTISTLVSTALRTGSEVVAGFAEDFGESWSPSRYWTQSGSIYQGSEVTVNPTQDPRVLEDHVVWNKLYLRDHLDRHRLRFPSRAHCEDMVFSARAALLAQSMTVVPRLVYRHRRHDQAISASYTRARTLNDWIGESLRTVESVRELGTEASLRHYLVHFVRTQWWTRARGVGRGTAPALLARLRQLSSLIAGKLDAPGRQALGPWYTACLDFFAAGSPATFIDDRLGIDNPLRLDAGRTVEEARAILHGMLLLGDHGDVSRRMAAAIVVERVLRPIADGYLDPRSEVRDQALATYVALQGTYLDHVIPGGASTEARIDRFLGQHGYAKVALLSVHRERRGFVLRGTVVPTYGAQQAVGATAVLTDVSSGQPSYFPVTWTQLADARLWRWQVVVPSQELTWSARYRLEVRFDGEHGPRGRGTAELSPHALPEIARGANTLSFPEHLGADARPVKQLFMFPAWRDNPYTNSLQLELFARGYALRGTSKLAEFVGEAANPRGGVVHIQWPSVVTDEALSEVDAHRRVEEFLGALHTAKRLGRGIVWTVHNVLPHDTEYTEAAIRLHQGLADLADVVHVMNSQTVDVASEYYRIDPAKVVVVPHASYAGVYGAPLARDEARAAIAASRDSTAVLFFGQVRPYKGLDHLVDALRDLSAYRDDFELLIAGKPIAGGEQSLESIRRSGIRATTHLEFVPDSEVSAWFSAADVLVLPHRRVLNSGTLYLGATFGLPTVLPDESHLRADFGDQAWVRFFDPSQPARSIARLLDDGWYRSAEVRDAALAFAEANPPMLMSRRFATVVEELAAKA